MSRIFGAGPFLFVSPFPSQQEQLDRSFRGDSLAASPTTTSSSWQAVTPLGSTVWRLIVCGQRGGDQREVEACPTCPGT